MYAPTARTTATRARDRMTLRARQPPTRSSTRRTTARSASWSTASRGCCPPCTCASATRSTCTAPPAAGRCSPPAATGCRSASRSRCSTGWSTRARSSTTAPTTARWSRTAAPAGHRRGGEAARADRAGREGRRRAGPHDTRPPSRRGSWPRPPCWRCRCARCPSGPAPAASRDDEDDLDLPHWAGVLPLRLTAGLPEPDAGVTVPVPAYLRPAALAVARPGAAARRARRSWSRWTCRMWTGCSRRPRTRRCGGTSAPAPTADRSRLAGVIVADALAARHRGERVPWVQRCAGDRRGGRHHLLLRRSTRRDRALAIGHTFLGRRGLAHRRSTPRPSCCC